MTRRVPAYLVLTALFMGAACWLTTAWAQEKPKKPATEEEKKPAAKPKSKPAAEEDDSKKKPRAPVGPAVNLADEAKKEQNPDLKKLLLEFAETIDTVTTVQGTVYKVRPLPVRYDPNTPGTLGFDVLPDGGKEALQHRLDKNGIKLVTHYEVRALAEGRRLREIRAAEQAGARYRSLQVAEMILAKGLGHHLSLREQKLRKGDSWDRLDEDLRKELLAVQIDQVKALVADKRFPAAETQAMQLFNQHRRESDVHLAIESVYVAQAKAALEQKNYQRAREHLEVMDKLAIEPSDNVKGVQEQLQLYAQGLLRKAEELIAQKKDSEALQPLLEAERAWPRLPGLRDHLLRLRKDYPVLRVGVRGLPNLNQMLPTTAQTDVEKMAVRLMFERLLELRGGPSARDGYECKVALEPPFPTPYGWEVTLAPDVFWSDGKPLTADDIRRSWEILVDPRSPYYDPTAKETFTVDLGEDARRVRAGFTRGHFDPLALLTFPIVSPRQLVPGNSPRQPAPGTPLGTGPYMYKETQGNEMVFLANPHYRRAHCPEGPSIREVRFVKYDNFDEIRRELIAGKVQLVLDLRSQEADQLEGTPDVEVMTATDPRDAKSPSLKNPRVYFLAPNHRKPALQDEELRHAIAFAIDREKILNEAFRGKNRKQHPALTGPFPVDSWGYNPDSPTPAKLFNTKEARDRLARAKGAGNLSLQYPSDDLTAAPACQRIQAMLKEAGIQVNLVPKSKHEIALEFAKEKPDFDLVYWSHDFEDETLSLWPLFDPSGAKGGRNYIGYTLDGDLQGVFQNIQGSQDFLAVVRPETQKIHEMILRKMVLIPLWQIERPAAVHRSLKITRLHPLWIFDDAELWKLERRG